MRKILISYADDAMAYSLNRIGRQARRLGIFDEIILYTPADVPQYVKDSPLFVQPRGAGYWIWKPALILETLRQHEDGDIVVYADAGCTLRKTIQWDLLFRLMQRFSSICFQYDADMPEWQRWGNSSSEIWHWTKKSTLDFLEDYLGDSSFYHYHQIMGGVIFMKNKNNILLNEWLKIMLEHPEIIMDPSHEEWKDQLEGFAGHRHDQAILTPLAMRDAATLVLPEISERYSRDAFVWASRIRARNRSEYLKIQCKHFFRRVLGDSRFESIKHTLK